MEIAKKISKTQPKNYTNKLHLWPDLSSSAVFHSRDRSSILRVSKTVKTRKLIAKVVTSKTVSPSQERNSLSWKNIGGREGFLFYCSLAGTAAPPASPRPFDDVVPDESFEEPATTGTCVILTYTPEFRRVRCCTSWLSSAE